MEHRVKNSVNPPFLPHTEAEIREMLDYIGLSSIEDLFNDIPSDLLLKKELTGLPGTHGEMEAQKHFSDLMGRNITTNDYLSFLGGGIYNRFIPSTVPAITGRSEFYSSYTPYAPEISQGMLQTLFEYQSMVCELAGMEAANSSMYEPVVLLTISPNNIVHAQLYENVSPGSVTIGLFR